MSVRLCLFFLGACVCERERVRVCVRVCVCVRVRACVRAFELACVSLHACECVCVLFPYVLALPGHH